REQQPDGSGELADLRRTVEVGLTAVSGRLDVIIERLEQQDKRATRHDQQIGDLDDRLDWVERTAVTRDDMEARQRRTISIVTVIVSAVGVVTTVVLALIT